MPKMNTQIFGSEELFQNLRQYPEKLATDLLKRAMKPTLQSYAAELAQSFRVTPTKSGGKTKTMIAIADSVKASFGTRRKTFVYGRVRVQYPKTGSLGARDITDETSGELRAKLAHLVEFGRKSRLPYAGKFTATRLYAAKKGTIESAIISALQDSLRHPPVKVNP